MGSEGRRSSDSETVTPAARGVPWQIWVVVFMLGLEGVGNLLAIPHEPGAARWLLAKCLLITGLIRGWRLVFFLTLVSGALHVLAFATLVPITAFLNLVLDVLVISAWQHFFASDNTGAAVRFQPTPPAAFDPEFDA